jgi:hypothetical protein
MKMRQPSPEVLLLSDFPWLVGGFCALVFLASLLVALATSIAGSMGAWGWFQCGFAMLLSGIGVLAFFKRTAIRLDRNSGKLTWSRAGVLGTRRGGFTLADIQSVELEFVWGGITRGPRRKTWRVALTTPAGRWPLTDYYSGSQAEAERTRERLRTFLSLAPPASR